MTLTTAVSIVAVLLALLLVSAAWTARKPVWQIVSGPPQESLNRVPVVEFCLEARQRGWDFAADEQLIVDLAIGLREAALDGAVEMWGRKCRMISVLRTPDEPLVRIPAEFWKHHDIDGLAMAIAGHDDDVEASGRHGASNVLIQTRAIPTSDPDFEDATYTDLHLNYMQATEWLQTDAKSCRKLSGRGDGSL
jgi:hypothetical protein